jgi:hypothetical protein
MWQSKNKMSNGWQVWESGANLEKTKETDKTKSCSNMVVAIAGSWLLSPHKTVHRLWCVYPNVKQKFFPNVSVGE